MSLKQEIEVWVKALGYYDNNEFDESLQTFSDIADTSKILFNCGVIQATLGEHEKAVKCYASAIKLDQYLAVAYFQQGVSNFLMGDFEEALANFNDTLLYLRGNKYINYEQLGLKFKLYSCEVLFNRGLCYIYLQQMEQGLQDLSFAVQEKAVPDHDVIDEAIKENAEGYTVFSIPVGVVYRPNEAKVKNLRAKDYLGKAKLVAAVDRNNTFTGFTGSELRKLNGPEAAKDDRPEANISFAASNLVKPDLKSRARQGSEPPAPSRDVFPPTPPPDADRMSASSGGNAMTRADSVRAGPRPRPLDLTVAGFEKSRADSSRSSERSPRNMGGRTRTQSERGGPRAPSNAGLTRMQSDRRPSYASSRGDAMSPRGGYDDAYDDVYDMYGRQSMAGRSARGGGRGNFISEEDEDEYGGFDEPEFDMMPRGSARGSRGQGRAVEVRKIRVKVHADDTRYVMVGTAIEFRDFIDQIRQKFGIRQSFKIKIRDDGDMITMADQDDLEMALMASVSDARKERNEMGKMEVWIQPV